MSFQAASYGAIRVLDFIAMADVGYGVVSQHSMSVRSKPRTELLHDERETGQQISDDELQ